MKLIFFSIVLFNWFKLDQTGPNCHKTNFDVVGTIGVNWIGQLDWVKNGGLGQKWWSIGLGVNWIGHLDWTFGFRKTFGRSFGKTFGRHLEETLNKLTLKDLWRTSENWFFSHFSFPLGIISSRNFPKWSKMIQNAPKWSKMIRNFAGILEVLEVFLLC